MLLPQKIHLLDYQEKLRRNGHKYGLRDFKTSPLEHSYIYTAELVHFTPHPQQHLSSLVIPTSQLGVWTQWEGAKLLTFPSEINLAMWVEGSFSDSAETAQSIEPENTD